VTRHCYDTSILIDVLRAKRRAVQLLRSHEGDERATTVVSMYELSLGATTPQRERAALELLEPLQVLSLGSDVAWTAGRAMRVLQKQGKTPPLRDLLAGTIAKAAGCRLYTSDRRFPSLEGLDLMLV
jgi:predicted nucleic acid-binding protein